MTDIPTDPLNLPKHSIITPIIKPKVNNQGPDSKVDLPRAVKLLAGGASYSEVGKIFGVGKQAVMHLVNKYVSDGIDLQIYKTHRADILASKQLQILKSITDDDIQKASAYQRVGMFGILYDKERLERGQSTQNLAFKDMSRDLSEMDKEIKVLEAELGELSTDSETCG